MELNELKLRFTLQQLVDDHLLISAPLSSNASKKLRKAAVLIAIVNHEDGLHLLLTQRPLHLRAHPGQISFPGGKVEKTDKNPIDTALREAEEEIGLLASNVDVLGLFPAHNTFTGFEITPIIGLVKSPFTPVLDPGEVADCFTVPLTFFMDANNRHQKQFLRAGRQHTVFFIPYKQRFIWGATAAMIDLLCRHLSATEHKR